MVNKDKTNLLSSWKEIAKYLNCQERTCQRWEKNLGLPVYRIDESSRSTIYAYKNEIDAWLKEKSRQKLIHTQTSTHKISLPKITLISLFAVIIISMILFWTLSKRHQPYDFRIQHSILSILDEKGKVLWSFDTGVENLAGEEFYKKKSQYKRSEGILTTDGRPCIQMNIPIIMIRDLDNDGHAEILFSIQTQDELNEGRLYCFDFKGRELWHFDTGREMIYGGKTYFSIYRIDGFDTCDYDNDGELEIIVLSAHRHDFPTQLAVLNSEGKKLGEYWNSGRMADFIVMDINQDGRLDLIVAGMNNEYKKSCLIVFDTAKIEGGSPQSADFFSCKDLAPGSERCYVLIPKTEDAIVPLMESLTRIEALNDSWVRVETNFSFLIYEFNQYCQVLDVRLSHRFQQMYNDAYKSGKITKALDYDSYVSYILSNILYYDGKKWVSEPAMSNSW